MLTFTSDLTTHLQGETTKLTVCWAVTKSDGTVLRGTAHDKDIVISSGTFAGTYQANMAITSSDVSSKSDGSVTNLDVQGGFQVDAQIPDLTVADVEGGLFDQASAVLFMCRWDDPDDGQRVLLNGTLGEFHRDSDGGYRTEVRGLAQALSQQIVRTYSERCNVVLFGDERCMFDVASATRTGTVTEVTDRRNFEVELDEGTEPVNDTYYNGGRLLFTSGDNSGFAREVQTATIVGSPGTATIQLWDETPADVEVGDTISLPPGCDRRYETCRDVHDNLVNFRGYGIFAVGKDRLKKGVL